VSLSTNLDCRETWVRVTIGQFRLSWERTVTPGLRVEVPRVELAGRRHATTAVIDTAATAVVPKELALPAVPHVERVLRLAVSIGGRSEADGGVAVEERGDLGRGERVVVEGNLVDLSPRQRTSAKTACMGLLFYGAGALVYMVHLESCHTGRGGRT
jgi:hypothetical protein